MLMTQIPDAGFRPFADMPLFQERIGINTKIQGLEGMGRNRKSMQDFVHQQYESFEGHHASIELARSPPPPPPPPPPRNRFFSAVQRLKAISIRAFCFQMRGAATQPPLFFSRASLLYSI